MPPLKNLQWNICGMLSKFNLLRAAIDTDAFDIVLLQETLIWGGQLVSYKGYRAFYFLAVAERARWCGILVRNVLNRTRGPRPALCGEGVEVLTVMVTLTCVSLAFSWVYNDQTANPDMTKLLSRGNDELTFIGGYFNAHQERWGSERRNRTVLHFAATRGHASSRPPKHLAAHALCGKSAQPLIRIVPNRC